jgi:tetratricopeptide (TPR) repeat protein
VDAKILPERSRNEILTAKQSTQEQIMSRANNPKPVRVTFRLAIFLLGLLAASHFAVIYAQDKESIAELKKSVSILLEQTKYTEAVPLLEKIVAAEPNNAEMHYYLGSSLLGLEANTRDDAAKMKLRVRARAEFIKAKELGSGAANIDAMIEAIRPDGSKPGKFSTNVEAESQMNEAEALYSRGQIDDALKAYQKALTLDPTLYHAALFSGDVYMQKGDYDQAEVWYKRAIAIDPNKETAYRYSATPLMKQKKYDEARDRYVEAYITEPYNRFSASGLTQWAQATKTSLAHPDIEVPTKVRFDEKGDVKIDLDASALMGKDDGGFAWISYGTTRSLWHKEKFRQAYPNATVYRHTLAEEVEALRSVLTMATSDKKINTSDKKIKLSPSLSKLKKLDDDGLLEPYILLARPDADIARDFPAYLKSHRDKLRRYVVEYVIKGGGN